MIQGEYKVNFLKPEEGHMLTQSGDVQLKDRLISDLIFLAINDDKSNYKEITMEEAQSILDQQEELRLSEEQEMLKEREILKEQNL